MILNNFKHKIIFKDGSKKVYSLNEIIIGNLDTSTIDSVKPIVARFSKMFDSAEMEVFKGDIIELDVTLIKESESFWDSHAGNFMKENGYTKLIITVNDDERIELNYTITFEKNGKVITEQDHEKYSEEDKSDFNSEELLDLEKAYTQKSNDEGSRFIRYILSKGGLVL